MGITGFGGTIDHTIGHTKLVLKFGPFVRLLRFHVIDSTVSCLALLGRPWMHKYKLVLSIYHQCVEGLLDEKPIHIPHNDTPFDQAEANLLEVAIYNQLFISGEDATARPIGTSLPRWQEKKEQPKIDLLDPLKKKKNQNESKKMAWDSPKCEIIQLPDGCTQYSLGRCVGLECGKQEGPRLT